MTQWLSSTLKIISDDSDTGNEINVALKLRAPNNLSPDRFPLTVEFEFPSESTLSLEDMKERLLLAKVPPQIALARVDERRSKSGLVRKIRFQSVLDSPSDIPAPSDD